MPCILLSFEFEHILMWRGSDWKSSLPPLEENSFEVTKVQESFSGKESNEKVTHSGNVLTQIELVSVATSHKNCNLGEGQEKFKDPIASDTVLNSAKEVPALFHSTGISRTEPSADTPLEYSPLKPVCDIMDPSLKCQSIPTNNTENRGLAEKSEHSPDDYNLETKGKRNDGIKGTVLNSGSKVPSCIEGLLCLLEQAIDSGRALVLSEDELVDADLVYEKSVAFTKSIPRSLVFEHTQRKPSARRNGPDNHARIKKHLVENKLPSSHVEKKCIANGGSATQTNDHAQEFLSDVVPQGTLRVDELAKLLA